MTLEPFCSTQAKGVTVIDDTLPSDCCVVGAMVDLKGSATNNVVFLAWWSSAQVSQPVIICNPEGRLGAESLAGGAEGPYAARY